MYYSHLMVISVIMNILLSKTFQNLSEMTP